MEHFVSIILAEYELDEELVECILTSNKTGLLESDSEVLYETFDTDDDEQVLRVQIPRQLTEQESDEFAESLANKLFDLGYEDFEIEVSLNESELPFDLTDDLHVFMKNDPMFYRRVYFPTMTKITDLIKTKGKVNFTNAISPMIDKAIDAYCKKFNLPKSTKSVFTEETRTELIGRIRDEEMPNIQKGEY